MKISTKCRYGTRALLEIAKNYGKSPTKRKDICRAQKISDSYLENILIGLKGAGIVDTIRGVNGGYILAKPPESISLYEVATALEGSQAPVDCLDNASMCDRAGHCVTQDVWRKVHDAEQKVLRATSVRELVERDLEHDIPDYVI